MTRAETCGSPRALRRYEGAAREAGRDGWSVSECLGRDGGQPAWCEWWSRHWPEFCRQRRIEHLAGEKRWKEFDDDAFGLFYDLVVLGDPLVDRILDRVAEGWENLDFACWLQEWDLPRRRALAILEVVNINSALRLEPKFT